MALLLFHHRRRLHLTVPVARHIPAPLPEWALLQPPPHHHHHHQHRHHPTVLPAQLWLWLPMLVGSHWRWAGSVESVEAHTINHTPLNIIPNHHRHRPHRTSGTMDTRLRDQPSLQRGTPRPMKTLLLSTNFAIRFWQMRRVQGEVEARDDEYTVSERNFI